MSNLPMAAHFSQREIFLIGIASYRNVKILGSFHSCYYSMWDIKCLAHFKIFQKFFLQTMKTKDTFIIFQKLIVKHPP